MSSPLSSVFSAVEAGAVSRAEVAARTGLTRELTDASIDHLVRMGRLQANALGVTCPGGRCGSCASGEAGAPACDRPAAATAGRPVLLQISVRTSTERP